jgi:hypothetical protein
LFKDVIILLVVYVVITTSWAEAMYLFYKRPQIDSPEELTIFPWMRYFLVSRSSLLAKC